MSTAEMLAETLFSDDDSARWLARVSGGSSSPALYDAPARRPVHVLYGGARRFSRDTPAKLGKLARAALDEHAPTARHLIDRVGLDVDDDVAEEVHRRLMAKLDDEPIEDLRIDFEDGLGACSDEEEDKEARRAAAELTHLLAAGAGCPPFVGLRPRALQGPTAARALRTLRLFLGTFLDEGGSGELRITLPKVTSPDEVACLAELCDVVEARTGPGRLRLVAEIMVESPDALLRGGRLAVRSLVEAGAGRVESVHFGTYDYTAALGVAPAHQRADHPAAELARQCLLLELAGSGCEVSDGATHRLPLPLHRAKGGDLTAEQRAENEAAVSAGLRLHAGSITRALAQGIRRGWDLHPAQLLARYAAVFAFYLDDRASLSTRLAGFLARRGQGAATGADWDDAASARALVAHFRQGRACGAFTDDDLRAAGLAPEV